MIVSQTYENLSTLVTLFINIDRALANPLFLAYHPCQRPWTTFEIGAWVLGFLVCLRKRHSYGREQRSVQGDEAHSSIFRSSSFPSH